MILEIAERFLMDGFVLFILTLLLVLLGSFRFRQFRVRLRLASFLLLAPFRFLFLAFALSRLGFFFELLLDFFLRRSLILGEVIEWKAVTPLDSSVTLRSLFPSFLVTPRWLRLLFLKSLY